MNWIFEWTDIYDYRENKNLQEWLSNQNPIPEDYKKQEEYKDGTIQYLLWIEFEAKTKAEAIETVREFYNRSFASEVFRCKSKIDMSGSPANRLVFSMAVRAKNI